MVPKSCERRRRKEMININILNTNLLIFYRAVCKFSMCKYCGVGYESSFTLYLNFSWSLFLILKNYGLEEHYILHIQQHLRKNFINIPFTDQKQYSQKWYILISHSFHEEQNVKQDLNFKFHRSFCNWFDLNFQIFLWFNYFQ